MLANFHMSILKIVENMALETDWRRTGRPLTANFKWRFLENMLFKLP